MLIKFGLNWLTELTGAPKLEVSLETEVEGTTVQSNRDPVGTTSPAAIFPGLNTHGSPLQIVSKASARLGAGFTTTLNKNGSPKQFPVVGVTK